MSNLKKITRTLSLLSLGALSVALFSTGCDSGTSSTGTGGAGGKSAAGGAGGTATGGAAGGHGGSATGGAAGGHGGTAAGGAAGSAAGGHGGSATGGGGGEAAGGEGGSETGGAAGGTGGTAAGGAAGSSAGGAGGEANIMYQVTLTGAMEVLTTGQTASTAMGSASVVLNPNTGAVSVQGSFTGLSSAASAAHIHGPAAAGATAGVIVALTASPAVAGAISGTGTLTPEQVTAMKAGMTYINVHSANYPNGEIRGQIQ